MLLSDLCSVLNQNGLSTRFEGPDVHVHAANTLEDAAEGQISFLSNPKYLSKVQSTRASAVIVADGVALPGTLSGIRCADPYAAITGAIIALHGYRKHPQWGIDSRATIDASAQIGQNASIAPGVSIGRGVVVGANCTFYPGCYVGDDARIGDDCTLFPNVVVYDGSIIGHRVTIHAGSVVGEDGLGYAPIGDKWIKIPQVGQVVIGDDVEIGANCAIDRATLGKTEIGAGTKFGNVIVIGHGTKIGPNCLFVGLVGVAGSVTVGRHVTVAGQVGIAGHLTIGDDVMVGAQSGITGDIEPKTRVLGSPSMPAEDARRVFYATQKLPEWIKRIKDLEREVAQLQQRLGVKDANESCPTRLP